MAVNEVFVQLKIVPGIDTLQSILYPAPPGELFGRMSNKSLCANNYEECLLVVIVMQQHSFIKKRGNLAVES